MALFLSLNMNKLNKVSESIGVGLTEYVVWEFKLRLELSCF